METRTIGSLIEVYTGGGKFLTENVPTNFHTFVSRRILAAGQSADDFREVTAAERTALEAADAKWVKPSEDAVTLFAAKRGCVYNAATGFFEYADIRDLTYDDALAAVANFGFISVHNAAAPVSTCRFVFWERPCSSYSTNDMLQLGVKYLGMQMLEVVGSPKDAHTSYFLKSGEYTFHRCFKLRAVYGPMRLHSDSGKRYAYSHMFSSCPALETVKLQFCNAHEIDLSFADSPKLSDASIAYMVENAANTAPITITLHAEAYARLTDELTAAATAKQITFTTP